MSDTPLTDEEEFDYPPGIKVVTAIFARTLERDLAAMTAQREKAEAQRDAVVTGAKEALADAYKEMLEQKARAEAAEARALAMEKDAERLDWLEGEMGRELAWRTDGQKGPVPASLFRGNNPITRAAIDASRARA